MILRLSEETKDKLVQLYRNVPVGQRFLLPLKVAQKYQEAAARSATDIPSPPTVARVAFLFRRHISIADGSLMLEFLCDSKLLVIESHSFVEHRKKIVDTVVAVCKGNIHTDRCYGGFFVFVVHTNGTAKRGKQYVDILFSLSPFQLKSVTVYQTWNQVRGLIS